MTMTDPIADMLTRIRNAAALRKEEVRVPASTLKQAIADVLAKEGYLSKVGKEERELVLELAGERQLSGLKRISKPGRRVYAKSGELPRVRGGLGIAVVSTPQGVMTAHEARKRKLGGEVLAEVF
ncbi:MAG: 30S ribosomal protein S8 [bacterium]|nr:30S ribosomal protein S8 [bacterium]MDZ4247859.1 30S ribosomal protein S8 [Patescibacteria group bacterium]